MYGMVNQAVKDLVVARFGEDNWKSICSQVNISTEDFVFMDYYPDKLTYDLVGAVSKTLSIPPATVLSEFGKHWILYTAKEGYGPLMDMFGHSFKDCLINLNSLHARMGMTMPNITAPRFLFTEVDEKNYLVQYVSKRQGLCPMVEGLLNGLAEKYQTKAEIQFVEDPLKPEDKIFKIKLLG